MRKALFDLLGEEGGTLIGKTQYKTLSLNRGLTSFPFAVSDVWYATKCIQNFQELLTVTIGLIRSSLQRGSWTSGHNSFLIDHCNSTITSPSREGPGRPRTLMGTDGKVYKGREEPEEEDINQLLEEFRSKGKRAGRPSSASTATSYAATSPSTRRPKSASPYVKHWVPGKSIFFFAFFLRERGDACV